ncbi:MAG TPA: uroporphyrinogen-III synthase, partial [Lautropia sp.]|nr:uroporphyrinogen-III synthase [Lautropia sp.]
MTALVVLTQAAEGSDSLAGQLSAAGFQVERWPLVRLIPAATQTIRPVLERLGDFDWVLILSPSAVRLVARRMKELDIAWPANLRAGLVGPASVEAFRDCFGDAPMVETPLEPPHDARHLVELIVANQDFRQRDAAGAAVRVLVLNRPDGRTQWMEALRQNVQSVEVVAAYTAEPMIDGPSADLMRRLQQARRSGGPVHWVIGAGSHVDLLLQALPAGWAEWAKRQPVLVPHAAVLAHARAAGFEDACVYDDRPDLVERLQYLGTRHGPAPADPADSNADNEELSVLTL